MPLIEIRHPLPHASLGLWRIDDGNQSLSARQRERKAVASLLHAMTGDDNLGIGHEQSGKPFLSPLNSQLLTLNSKLSISHTRGYAAILLTDNGMLPGIDIERRSDRVERIAQRFIRPDEAAADTLTKLLLWSAKETVYKLFSEDMLQFFDMRMLSVDEKHIRMQNLKRDIAVDVCYEISDDYVLTYCLFHTNQRPGPS